MCLSPHTGIDCPDRLWKVLYWRYLGTLWMSSCALEWTWWSREFGPAHSPSNLTHSVITEKIVLFIDKTALKKLSSTFWSNLTGLILKDTFIVDPTVFTLKIRNAISSSSAYKKPRNAGFDNMQKLTLKHILFIGIFWCFRWKQKKHHMNIYLPGSL